MIKAINLVEKLDLFHETWTPKILGALNGQHVKIAKFQGEFPWHSHADEDELFLVINGSITIEFRDGAVHLQQGEMCIVPRGVEHHPVSKDGASVLLFEPASTQHTGHLVTEVTVNDQDWI